MNLELLKKLIKLANNNPNENEANLAARKVCKMIESDGYKLVGGDDIRRRPIQAPQQATTWNDVKRSTEPEFSSKPPTGGSNPFNWNPSGNPFRGGYYDDIFNYFYGRARRGGKTSDQEKAREQQQNTNYNPREPKSKEDTFHANDRTVTVNCRSCHTKFKMSYEDYFGEGFVGRGKPRTCVNCTK